MGTFPDVIDPNDLPPGLVPSSEPPTQGASDSGGSPFPDTLDPGQMPGNLVPSDSQEGKLAEAGRTTFTQAMGRGVDLLQSMAYGAAEVGGELSGSERLTQFGREGREANIAEAATVPRQQFTEIKGAGDVGQWMKETVGEQIPMMAPGLAGGAAGAAVGLLGGPAAPVTVPLGAAIGAFLPSAVLGVGEVQSSIKEIDPEAQAPGWALAGGTAIGTLDSVLPGKFGSTLARAFGKNTAEDIAKKILETPVKDTWIKRSAKGAAKGIATEGLTEATQEAIQAVTAAKGTETPVDWQQTGEQMLEAGAAGALMGGLVGGAGGAIEGRGRAAPEQGADRGEEAAPQPPEPDTGTAPVQPTPEPEPTPEPTPPTPPAPDVDQPVVPDGYDPVYDDDGKGNLVRVGVVDRRTGEVTPDAERPTEYAFQRFPIKVETRKGETRRGKTPDGEDWEAVAPVDYGYIPGVPGADGGRLDVYVGGDRSAQRAYVIDQIDPDSGDYDEQKVMLGFPNREAAERAYDAAHSDGRGPERRAAVTEMSLPDFSTYVESGRTGEPLQFEPPDWHAEARRFKPDYPPAASREAAKNFVIQARKQAVDRLRRRQAEIDKEIDTAYRKAPPDEKEAFDRAVDAINRRAPEPEREPTGRVEPVGPEPAARPDTAGRGGESGEGSDRGVPARRSGEPDQESELDFLRRVQRGGEPSREAAQRRAPERDPPDSEGSQQRPARPRVAPPETLVEKDATGKPFYNVDTAAASIAARVAEGYDPNEAAGLWVLEWGQNIGHEYLMVIGPDGEVVRGGTSQQRSSVNPPKVVFDAMQHREARLVAHHNHPSGGALSTPDISFILAMPGLDKLYSYGHDDGGTSYAQVPDAVSVITSGRNWGKNQRFLDYADGWRERYTEKLASQGMDRRKAWVAAIDMKNRAIARAGVIDYFSTYDISHVPGAEKEIDRVAQQIRERFRASHGVDVPDRSASGVRAEEGLAGLSDRDGGPGGARRQRQEVGRQSQEAARRPVKSDYQKLDSRRPVGLDSQADAPRFARARTGLTSNSFDIPSVYVKDYWNDHNLTFIQRALAAGKEAGRQFLIKTQDAQLRLKQLQKVIEKTRGIIIEEAHDAYLALEIWMGRAGKALTDFKQREMEPFIAKVNQYGFTIDEVEEFLYARHVKLDRVNERIARMNPALPDGGSGMYRRQADDPRNLPGYDDIYDKHRAAGTLAKMDDIASDFDRITRGTMRIRLRLGLIDPQTFRAWSNAYKHYVPLRGFADIDGTEDLLVKESRKKRPRTGRGFDVRGAESKNRLGRKSRAGELVATAFTMRQEAIVRGHKNEALQALVKLVQDNPNKHLWEIDAVDYVAKLNKRTGLVEYGPQTFRALRRDEIAVKVGGKVHYIRFKGDYGAQLLRIFTNSGAETSSTMIQMFARFNRYLAFMNTSMNPEFVIGNFLRDLQTAGINMNQHAIRNLQKRVFKDVPAAVKGAYGGLQGKDTTVWQKWFHRYAKAGGKIEFFGLKSIEDQRKELDAMLSDLDPTNLQKVKIYLRGVKGFIENANGAVENAVRLSVFRHLVESGVTEKQAASAARNLTVNFNRKGEWGSLINAFFLFYNASIQGSAVVVKAMRHKRVRAVVGTIVISHVLLDLLNAMMSPEDDDGVKRYDKINDWTKEHNIIIGNWWGDSKDPVALKIPMPYGYNVFAVIGYKIGEAIRGKTTPLEATADILTSAVNSFNPLGGETDLLDAIIPTVFKPWYEWRTNQNFLGNPIRPTGNPFDDAPRPDSESYFKSVTTASKAFARWLNTATGGNAVKPGAVDVSPELLDHLGAFIFGGTGAFVMRGNDFVVKALTGEEITYNNIPFARRVVEGENIYYDTGKYREVRSAVHYAEKEQKLFREQRDGDALRELRERAGPELQMSSTIKDTEKQLKKIRSARSKVENNDRIPSEQKKKLVEEYDLREKDAVRNALRRYRSYLDEAKARKR